MGRRDELTPDDLVGILAKLGTPVYLTDLDRGPDERDWGPLIGALMASAESLGVLHTKDDADAQGILHGWHGTMGSGPDPLQAFSLVAVRQMMTARLFDGFVSSGHLYDAAIACVRAAANLLTVAAVAKRPTYTVTDGESRRLLREARAHITTARNEYEGMRKQLRALGEEL